MFFIGKKTDSGYDQGSFVHEDLPELPPRLEQAGGSANSTPKKNKRFPATTKTKSIPAIFNRKKKHCQSAMAAIKTDNSTIGNKIETTQEMANSELVSEHQSDTGSDDIYEDTAQEGSQDGVMHSGNATMHSGTATMHSGIAPVHSGHATMHSGIAPVHVGIAPVHAGNENENQSESGDSEGTDYEEFDYPQPTDKNNEDGVQPSELRNDGQSLNKSDDSSSNDSIYDDTEAIVPPQPVHGRQNTLKNNTIDADTINNNSKKPNVSTKRKEPLPVPTKRDKSLSLIKENTHSVEDNTLLFYALYNCEGQQKGDLSFAQGDIIYIVEKETGSLWWRGRLRDQIGYVPSNYLSQVYGN